MGNGGCGGGAAEEGKNQKKNKNKGKSRWTFMSTKRTTEDLNEEEEEEEETMPSDGIDANEYKEARRIMKAWEKHRNENKGSKRISLLVLNQEEEIKKWTKVNYNTTSWSKKEEELT